MKKYTIKNYKGNIVDSLAKFQEKYPNVRVIEAVEDNGVLKIKAESKALDIKAAKALISSGGTKLRNAMAKVYDALGSHGDISGILDNGDELTPEEKDIVREFFEKVFPRAIEYTWKPYKSDWSDEDQETLEEIFDLCGADKIG